MDKTTQNLHDHLKTHLDYSYVKKNINVVILLMFITPLKTLLFFVV